MLRIVLAALFLISPAAAAPRKIIPPLSIQWDFNAAQATPWWIKYTRSTTAYCFNASGTAVSLANNVTCLDHTILGAALGFRIEGAATNVVIQNRDLTNAAWTATSVTTAKNVTGIDGVGNSATRLTATGANGTVLQSITLGSSARFQSAYILCFTCTGNIQMTLDNSTFTTLTSANCFQGPTGTAPNTSTWVRCQIPAQTVTNPTVGFKIVTSGDIIGVDFVQDEVSLAGATSPISTAAAAVTRNADVATLLGPFPWLMNQYQGSIIIEAQTNTAVSGQRLWDMGGSMYLDLNSVSQINWRNGTASQVQPSAGTGTFNAGLLRSGVAWNGAARSAVLGNGTVSVDTNPGFTVAFSSGFLGSTSGTSNACYCWFSKIWTYPTKLQDILLKAKTVAGAAL